MRKKTKLTQDIKDYVLAHHKVDTLDKMAKDLNFDVKILNTYIQSLKQSSQDDEESKEAKKQKERVTVMTKQKSSILDNMTVEEGKAVFHKTSEVQIDPKRVFVRPN